MICADFLAGSNLDNGDPATLLFSNDEILEASARRVSAGILGKLE